MSDATENLPALTERATEPFRSPLADMRAASMSVPVPVMMQALAEYTDRRQAFREWLLRQLVKGVHYGYPPGVEPRLDDDGNVMQWTKGRDGGKGYYKTIPQSQWKAKPSLYAAGADFVCDLLGVRDEYKADIDSWKQLGEPKGTFVRCCTLISRATKEVMGNGTGARKTGTKGGDENNAIKMADKSAKVAAVLNTWGLRDIFTQDIEHPLQPQHENPEHDETAPQATPREERVTTDDLARLFAKWSAQNQSSGDKRKDGEVFAAWVVATVGRRDFNVRFKAEWRRADLDKCWRALDKCPPALGVPTE